jgi:hypothetical protein
MKKILILLVAAVILSGCSNSDTGISYSKKNCSEPSNPYGDGGGHDAGFNWAEEKGVSSCGGKSQSFIDGCEEYLRQEEAYNSCNN